MTDIVDAPGASAAVVHPRFGRGRSLRLALVAIAIAALLIGIMQLCFGFALTEGHEVPLAYTLVYWVWAAAGIIAWWRRPSNGTGALLLTGGLAIFLAGLYNLDLPFLPWLGEIFQTAILAVAVHLLHAFPSGRLRGTVSIVTVAAGYGVALILQAPLYLLPADRPNLVTAAVVVQAAAGLCVMVVTAIVLIGRLRAAEPPTRRVLLPLYTYGILGVLAIPFSANVLQIIGAEETVIGSVQLVLLAGLPIAFLLGALFGGFSRTAEADALSAWLGVARSTRPAVAQALMSTLGDDSLRVVYWSDARALFVDEEGIPVPRGGEDGRRGWQDVHVQSRLVGAITYDPSMIADADSVGRAGSVLAIALDRERLTAALIASNEALLTSRLRIVETADRERTRIARDLHDGLQVQLVLLALEAQQIANAPEASAATRTGATELRERIDQAAADLRRLVHDVLPSALVERGLSAAAEDLADRLAIPVTLVSDVVDDELPPPVARTAYLIVAEALTNAVKHSGADAVTVELARAGSRLRVVITDDGRGGAAIERGTGLAGLVDRVDALGGSFELVSREEEGTELRVELPCA
ncbi:sensor histidine kinase [Herbiconiux sp. P16]|uniref:sensor histidine kinase n=1 Tax=Herbiconiux wuyangfengii TaxID=3342794 RepID=UPI0035BB8E53